MCQANRDLNKKQRKYFGIFLLLGFFTLAGAYYVLFLGNTNASDGEYFYIRSDDSYEQVLQNLTVHNLIENKVTFDLVAKQVNLPNKYKPGRYKIVAGMSNLELVRKLRSGKWEKVVIKLKSEMTRDSVLNYLADNLQASKGEVVKAMNGAWVQENGFTDENKWSIFLPDHYHFNWATTADKAILRFVDEYNTYWTADRKAKAKAQGLTTKEAVILASIVDGEAIFSDEMPTIAGLYLNRINKGIPLGADPTIWFVVGKGERRRLLYVDLKKAHPYNTYLNAGLPPGPIFCPDKRAIEAAIAPKTHNYYYMCAKPDGSLRHAFANGLAEHNRNAAAYRRSLDRQGVRR
ncbi:MAG: UPF0755 protein [Bacteroidia bacterium]